MMETMEMRNKLYTVQRDYGWTDYTEWSDLMHFISAAQAEKFMEYCINRDAYENHDQNDIDDKVWINLMERYQVAEAEMLFSNMDEAIKAYEGEWGVPVSYAESMAQAKADQELKRRQQGGYWQTTWIPYDEKETNDE